MFEFVLKPLNSDVISESFKVRHTIVKQHDTYSAKANKVIRLKDSSIWIKDEKEGIVTRKRSSSDIENCEENMATKKKQKTDDDTVKPKDVAVCTKKTDD